MPVPHDEPVVVAKGVRHLVTERADELLGFSELAHVDAEAAHATGNACEPGRGARPGVAEAVLIEFARVVLAIDVELDPELTETRVDEQPAEQGFRPARSGPPVAARRRGSARSWAAGSAR